jgi:hypothetical protein
MAATTTSAPSGRTMTGLRSSPVTSAGRRPFRSGPSQVVRLAGGAVATSSVTCRWRHGGRVLHHIVDPVPGFPPTGPGGRRAWPRPPAPMRTPRRPRRGRVRRREASPGWPSVSCTTCSRCRGAHLACRVRPSRSRAGLLACENVAELRSARRPRRCREPLMRRHGGGWPPLASAAAPVTLPSRVMVSSASGWPSTYRSKKASVTRAVRRSTGLVPSYGIRWLAPNRSR